MLKKTDVLIIGGGVIGLACAYYLLKEGRSVRIVERDTIGAGASGGNCGFIFTSHILPLCSPGVIKSELQRLFSGSSQLIIKPGLDISRFVWLMNFARRCNPVHLARAVHAREEILRYSKQLYSSLFPDEMMECDRKQSGILIVFKIQKEFDKYSGIRTWLEKYNLAADALNKEALLTLEPSLSDTVCGGWYYKTDAHVHPKKLMQEWKQAVLGKGAIVEENCALERLHLDNRRITGVATNQGIYDASEVVLAAGAWTSPIARQLKLNTPIQPAKGYSITFKRPRVFPEIPCIFYEKRVAATPWEDESRLGGIMEFSGYDLTVYDKRIQQIRAGGNDYLSEPLVIRDGEEWAGFRPTSYDDLPVIGRPYPFANLVVAAGHGTTGLSMAPGTGKLVAEIITETKPFMDISAFSPDRF